MLHAGNFSDLDSGDERSFHRSLPGGNVLPASGGNEDDRYHQEKKFHG
jgi:hypothetical protein